MSETDKQDIRVDALRAAADDFKDRARDLKDTDATWDPLSWALWNRCQQGDGRTIYGDPRAIAQVAYEECAKLLGFVEEPSAPEGYVYDESAHALYVRLVPDGDGRIVSTATMPAMVNADLDEAGNVLGVEVVNPWPRSANPSKTGSDVGE
ncbi:DUF2283 domain-containing protein [Microtetraspora sp. AC03309]|uniref:DUF2283 domain-containing protein n=1 Tax=Microtetraspora sp. AC03309 TaxID=2779376 RepID=UPI001E32AE5C|nr:DUF2283 domain-containing protein [Microtetraspora sp. AC03309]MCC5574516.1 DUF2283 domain-containing protein [Microtetraspora sp. AC03309]